MFRQTALFILAIAALQLCGGTVSAQSADAPVESNRLSLNTPEVIAGLSALRDGKQLLSIDDVQRVVTGRAKLLHLDLPSPPKVPLTPSQVDTRARRALARIGWFVRDRGGGWRAFASGGYAITSGGAVVTCFHCIRVKDLAAKEAYLFAADADLGVYSVSEILAWDQRLDAAIVRVREAPFIPLALNDQVLPGETVYLLSDPGGVGGFFSSGIINRFYWKRDGIHDLASLDGVRDLRIHGSTDWSMGSSGAAILDSFGNAVGHVSTISTLNSKPATGPALAGKEEPRQSGERVLSSTYVVLHEAVPARGVRLLIDSISPTTQPAQ
jgi:S1-C subfamily serine protease